MESWHFVAFQTLLVPRAQRLHLDGRRKLLHSWNSVRMVLCLQHQLLWTWIAKRTAKIQRTGLQSNAELKVMRKINLRCQTRGKQPKMSRAYPSDMGFWPYRRLFTVHWKLGLSEPYLAVTLTSANTDLKKLDLLWLLGKTQDTAGMNLRWTEARQRDVGVGLSVAVEPRGGDKTRTTPFLSQIRWYLAGSRQSKFKHKMQLIHICRRIVVRTFKGKVLIDVREFYEVCAIWILVLDLSHSSAGAKKHMSCIDFSGRCDNQSACS